MFKKNNKKKHFLGGKMKKINLSFLIVFCMSFFLFASGTKEIDTQNTVRISVLNGPSGVGLVSLFENQALAGSKIEMEVSASPDVLLPKLIKGEIDMGILPPNAAAKVFNTNGNIVVLAVVGKGMLNLITADPEIKSIENLKGKKVFVAGQGSTPEYLLRYLAGSAGLEVDTKSQDAIELDFSIPTAELAAALASGKIDYAFLPEPFASLAQMNNKNLQRSFDVQETYKKFSGIEDSYPMTVLVARKDFVDGNRNLTKKVLEEVKAAIVFANENPEKAGQLVEKYSLGLKAEIVSKSIPFSAFEYASANESQKDIESLLSVFLDFAPQAIGGKLPSNEFYFD